jgi:hypothetical protein
MSADVNDRVHAYDNVEQEMTVEQQYPGKQE